VNKDLHRGIVVRGPTASRCIDEAARLIVNADQQLAHFKAIRKAYETHIAIAQIAGLRVALQACFTDRWVPARR
jgi:hypothetical protein